MLRLFVPGRLCLLGEHSDWAAGYRDDDPSIAPGLCLVAGTDQGLHAEAEALSDTFELATELADGTRHTFRVPVETDALEAAARAGGFVSYAAGTLAELRRRHPVAGLRLTVRADLPVQKGLSSSAAICVLVVRAAARLYDLDIDLREEMELAYRGERRAGSACGRMDQICARGRRASLLHFDRDTLAIEAVEPATTLHLLIVDLNGSKDTRRILADLNACFPDAPGAVAARVRTALGEANSASVRAASDALRAGDAARLGAVMAEAQARFDADVAPACDELRAPRLRAVLAHPATRELAYGGKGVGSQGDGCAQLVTPDPETRDALARRLASALGVETHPLTLEPAARRGGADA